MADMAETTDVEEGPDPFAGEWEVDPAPKRKSERRQRHAVISVRLNLDELRLVESQATQARVGVSTYLREAGLHRAGMAVGVNSVASALSFDSSAAAWGSASLLPLQVEPRFSYFALAGSVAKSTATGVASEIESVLRVQELSESPRVV